MMSFCKLPKPVTVQPPCSKSCFACSARPATVELFNTLSGTDLRSAGDCDSPDPDDVLGADVESAGVPPGDPCATFETSPDEPDTCPLGSRRAITAIARTTRPRHTT